MTQLAQSCNASDRRLIVDTPPPAEGSLVQLEEEIVRFRYVGYSLVLHGRDPLIWVVERGVDGTIAASHDSGKELVSLVPVYGVDPIEGAPAGVILEESANWGGATLRDADETKSVTLVAGDAGAVDPYTYVTLGPATVELGAFGALQNVVVNLDNTTGILSLAPSVALVISLATLPTSDPGVAGQVYSDGVPSAGVPKALMISGGTAP